MSNWIISPIFGVKTILSNHPLAWPRKITTENAPKFFHGWTCQATARALGSDKNPGILAMFQDTRFQHTVVTPNWDYLVGGIEDILVKMDIFSPIGVQNNLWKPQCRSGPVFGAISPVQCDWVTTIGSWCLPVKWPYRWTTSPRNTYTTGVNWTLLGKNGAIPNPLIYFGSLRSWKHRVRNQTNHTLQVVCAASRQNFTAIWKGFVAHALAMDKWKTNRTWLPGKLFRLYFSVPNAFQYLS